MNIYGRRFVDVGQFINYCRELNVKTDRRELEHYEKIGAMLPVARVVYPDEYVILTAQNTCGLSDEQLERWPDLHRLMGKPRVLPEDYGDLTDEELIHCFDREMERNQFLHRPTGANYHPWSSYRSPVADSEGVSLYRSSAEHYYSYWQVHQLYYIQKFPDLYKNRSLIQFIPEEEKKRFLLPMAPSLAILADFKGSAHYFDALSFWHTAYGNERCRTFAHIPELDGIRNLDDDQYQAYQDKLSKVALLVQARYKQDRENSHIFLRRLIELYCDYRNDERYKLAEEIKKDIFALENLMWFGLGDNREKILDELGKISHFAKQTFAHLDILAKERDETRMLMVRMAESAKVPGNPDWSFSDSEIDELLGYCEQEALTLLMTSLSGMVAIGDESQGKFRRTTRYTNLKNTLNAFEYLLKNLAEKADYDVGGKTLNQTVQKVMCKESWFGLFQEKQGSRLLSAKDTEAFLNNLDGLLSDNELSEYEDGYWAQTFLVTCLARNLTTHNFPAEGRYYGDLFGKMLNSVILTIFYTWKLAKKASWI